MPRTVCTNSGLAGLVSILRRRRLTWHVDGALTHAAAIAGERHARHRLARRCGENAQHFAFAVGQANDVLALA